MIYPKEKTATTCLMLFLFFNIGCLNAGSNLSKRVYPISDESCESFCDGEENNPKFAIIQRAYNRIYAFLDENKAFINTIKKLSTPTKQNDLDEKISNFINLKDRQNATVLFGNIFTQQLIESLEACLYSKEFARLHKNASWVYPFLKRLYALKSQNKFIL
jgi:hypothetical protein